MRTKTPRRPPSRTAADYRFDHDREDVPAGSQGADAGGRDRAAFEKLVEEALEALPRKFKDLLQNITVMVEDFPSPETMRDMKLRSPYQLLGLYHGVPLDKRGAYYGNVPPDVVVIYQRPIEAVCASEEALRDQVRATVIHEVGHYFGLSESDLRRIERESRRSRS